MLCGPAKWADQKDIMFDSIFNHRKDFLKDPTNDLNWAKSLWALIDSADVVIAHNGDDFDLKWANTLFLKHNLTPVSTYKTVDTLKVIRNNFRLLSNKLDYVCRSLKLGEKLKHEGLPLWIKCMKGNQESWKLMEKYNKRDVLILENVYEKIKPFIKNHPNLALYYDSILPTCPNCSGHNFNKRGFSYTAVNKYQRYVCTNCGKNVRSRNSELTKEKSKSILNQIN